MSLCYLKAVLNGVYEIASIVVGGRTIPTGAIQYVKQYTVTYKRHLLEDWVDYADEEGAVHVSILRTIVNDLKVYCCISHTIGRGIRMNGWVNERMTKVLYFRSQLRDIRNAMLKC